MVQIKRRYLGHMKYMVCKEHCQVDGQQPEGAIARVCGLALLAGHPCNCDFLPQECSLSRQCTSQ